jgi:membrane complex biogenesis BtpA family protein
MNSLAERLRAERRTLIGVVHLLATPGAPRFAGDVARLLARAESDARALREGGADAIVVENFGDVPFVRERVAPETLATLALAVERVRAVAGDLPVGVNVLRNDARAGLGLCAATGASFLRVNVHTGAMLTDQGLIEGRAAETLRERARLCPQAWILADVHVKHATPLGRETIEEAAAEALERGLADALVLSGVRTGAPPGDDLPRSVRRRLPGATLLIGSGLDRSNAARLLACAQGAIVGTALQEDGITGAPVDPRRVDALRAVLDGLPPVLAVDQSSSPP